MAEGTPIQNHLYDFNSVAIDLESLGKKLEDKHKAILLVFHCLPLISILKNFFRIVAMALCLLRMLRPICFPKKSLTLKYVLKKVKAYKLLVNPLIKGTH